MKIVRFFGIIYVWFFSNKEPVPANEVVKSSLALLPCLLRKKARSLRAHFLTEIIQLERERERESYFWWLLGYLVQKYWFCSIFGLGFLIPL